MRRLGLVVTVADFKSRVGAPSTTVHWTTANAVGDGAPTLRLEGRQIAANR